MYLKQFLYSSVLGYASIFCLGLLATIICGAIMKKSTHQPLTYMKSVFGYQLSRRELPCLFL
jgi:hypothetical protein